MNYEEVVKQKLYELWLKESHRIDKHNKSWSGERIMLGSGILKIQGLTSISEILSTIQEFVIDVDMLDALDYKYDELEEVYRAVLSYRKSIRLLKDLKTKMQRNEDGYNH